jgi:hypothetical protein
MMKVKLPNGQRTIRLSKLKRLNQETAGAAGDGAPANGAFESCPTSQRRRISMQYAPLCAYARLGTDLAWVRRQCAAALHVGEALGAFAAERKVKPTSAPFPEWNRASAKNF